jgi:hypothetical protein
LEDEAVKQLQWVRVQPHTNFHFRICEGKEGGSFWPFLSLYNKRSRSTHSCLGERSSYWKKNTQWTHSPVQITQGISIKSPENSLPCIWHMHSPSVFSFSPFLLLSFPRSVMIRGSFVANKTIHGNRHIHTWSRLVHKSESIQWRGGKIWKRHALPNFVIFRTQARLG